MIIERRAVPPAEPGARELTWSDPRPDEDPRVSRIARGRGGVEFEVCSSGGAYFIRRTRFITGTRTTVHETERKVRAEIEQDWADLLAGQAH